MKNFRELQFWKKSQNLAVSIYESTKLFPPSEQFGLTNQMRRSAVSISSNIAEGSSRRTDKDFARFLEIAIGSAHELETQLEIAYRINYLSKDEFSYLEQETLSVTKMIGKYKSSLIGKN